MSFSINCLILGDKPEDMFTVNISDDNKDIHFLKTLIKAVKPYLDSTTVTLDLCHVDFSLEEDGLERLANFEPASPALYPGDKLRIFKDGPKDHIQVIVKPTGMSQRYEKGDPVQLLSINCFILGEDSIFDVEIERTKIISSLKRQIKVEKASCVKDLDASDLELWQVHVPTDDLSSINRPTGAKLENSALLSEVFQSWLSPRYVHVVVHIPTRPESRNIAGREQEGRRDSFGALNKIFENTCNNIAKALPPSNSAKSSTYPKSQIAYNIYDGRYKDNEPRATVAPPIELFHPAFAHFLDEIRCTCNLPHSNIPEDFIRLTTKYMQASSANYLTEIQRRNKLNPILGSVLGCDILLLENEDQTRADGIATGSTGDGSFLYMLKEDKNELGAGESDPSTQAGLSAARSWVQARFATFRNATACPTFLIASAGPWFAVLGFALTDRVIVQRLTDFIWVGIDSALSSSHVNRVARIFYALKTSLGKLNTYYLKHAIVHRTPAPTRYFPSITSYPRNDGQDVQFKYLGYLESGFDCLAIRAQTCTEPAQDIVVKFVERYSERAHHTLAEAGLAPRLVHYGPLHFDSKQPSHGSLHMVVMEYIDGDTFALSKMSKDVVKTVQSDLKRALTLLHDMELVFGDLRPPNVMITKENKVKVIDFDWAGETDQVKYPHLLSPAVPWPEGVRSLDPIKKVHDLEMLGRLFAT